MARYDKYDPKVGGFRATLAADYVPGDVDKAYGVGLDANGRVVLGAGQTGVLGVLVLTKARKAGEVVDIMTSGEIVEFGPSDDGSDPGVDFGTAGTIYYSDDAGVITDTNAEGSLRVGHTVEGQRLVVRCEQTTAAGAVTWSSLVPQGGIPETDLASAVSASLGLADSAVQPGDKIPVADIQATGTPSASNYLKGDGSWGTVT